jgi:hypothetical protein
MKDKEKLPVKEFKIIDEETGELIGSLDTISIVKNPAIELEYQLFNQIAQKQNFEINAEKQIITGPAMRANFEILRQDSTTKEYYYGIFSPEQIQKCMEYYMQKGNTDKANFNHKQDNYNDKFFISESWLVNDPTNDKATSLGFKEVSKGDWYISYKVTDPTMWESIKNGDYTGFSVEANLGVFNQILNEDEILKNIEMILYDKGLSEDEKENKIKDILNK